MKLNLEALRTRQSSRFDSRRPGSPYWITEELPIIRPESMRAKIASNKPTYPDKSLSGTGSDYFRIADRRRIVARLSNSGLP
jgi:hypothetical protein